MDPDELVADLDPDQRAAVTSPSTLVAVIAGAGSGKTRVLTRRIAYRIATETADARHTLALTFTREAAGEMRRRLLRLGAREHVEAGTFHSVMLRVLTQRWADTDRRPSTVVSDRRRLLADVVDGGDRRSLGAYLAEVDWATARGISPDDYASTARREQRRPAPGVDRCAEIFADFDRLKRRRGVIDFDDVLGLTIREMRRDPEFADAVRWRFRHVLVDEAQDLNPLQHTLVDLLRAGRDDLFLVGDPAQAIYAFNGADPTLLVDVDTRFPGIEVIRLPVNHRSTPQVVDAGVHVLDVSGQPFDLRSHRPDGRSVELVRADDESDEIRRVVGVLRTIDPRIVRSGEVAVLARTNAQLGPIVDGVEAAGLPVHRNANAAGSPLQQAVRQAAQHGSASRLRGWAHDVLDADAGSARHNDDGEERRVAAAALEFLRAQPLGDGATFRSWVATTNPFADASTEGVTVSTFHAAKGREWHTVILSGVESGLVPHKSATTAAARAEEARLLYVAMTRATDHLVVSGADRRGGYARTTSPLIEDLDLSTAPVAPPPQRHRRATTDPLREALHAWRDEAARRGGILPAELCSDRDLDAISTARPTTVDALAAATTFGPITAARLAPELLDVVSAAADATGVQSATSTITGA